VTSKRNRAFWYLKLSAPGTRPHLVYVADKTLPVIMAICEEYRALGWDVAVT
jgi:hypothetical protein